MIERLSGEQLDLLRKAGDILRRCIDDLATGIRPGVSTKDLEVRAEGFIKSHDGKTAFKGYRGYPAAICTAPNNVVVHGIPNENNILKEGDIVSVDVGVEYAGIYADAAKTFPVGKVSPKAELLISVTEEALSRGIEKAKSGNRVQDISWAVQSFVESKGFNVVRAFVGHGIGRRIHAEPEVPNFGRPGKGPLLENGMALAIEPMVNEGVSGVEILEDGWTAVTADGKLSAHFEHTVIINGDRPEIVT